jgi:hypothetical protein
VNAPFLLGSGVVNALLLSVAQKVQLPPSSYRLAADRYETLGQHLERESGTLRGLVRKIYPQGSVAIGAVVSSKFETDEFDVDVMIELGIAKATPATVLDTLYHAIRGERGSRYYSMTTRKTRCVTVDYDEMHIDFTPAVRRVDPRERVSTIFHAHEDDPPAEHYAPVANPWGFANWFEAQMPAARLFMEQVLRKRADPLPDTEELNEKSLPLIALQLIKRWRNKCYDQRGVRRPPSVLLTCYVAQNAGVRAGLLEELIAQVRYILNEFETHDREERRVEVMNPACDDLDCFTDRWPEKASDQALFLQDLRKFAVALAELANPQTMARYQEILGQLFGERATKAVMESFASRFGHAAISGSLHHRPESGATALRESGIARVAPATGALITPRHRHFGSDEG